MLKIFFYQGLIIFLYAVAWFSIALAKHRNDVADIAWGGGFVCAAFTAYIIEGTNEARTLLAVALVTIWGLRLMLHIGWRNRGKPETTVIRLGERNGETPFWFGHFSRYFYSRDFCCLSSHFR